MAATGRRARRKPTKGDKVALVFLTIVLGGLFAASSLHCGGSWVDKQLADREGAYATAWVQTTEVSPGDAIAVHVISAGGKKAVITSIHARIGDAKVQVAKGLPRDLGDVTSKSRGADEVIVVATPSTLPLGDTRLRIDVDGLVALDTGTGSYTQHDWSDSLDLNVELRSDSSRALSRWLTRLLALLAWTVAAMISYAIARWARGAPLLDGHQVAAHVHSLTTLLAVVSVLALSALGVVGQLAFVRPVARTTALCSMTFITSVQLLWIGALVGGGWLGLRARRGDLRWMPVRIRAVMGSPAEVGYRDAGAVLAASTPRCADRLAADDVLAPLRRAGFTVSASGRRIQIANAAGRVMRMRAHDTAPWAPEDLSAFVLGDFDAAPVVRALAQAFGALQYTSPRGISYVIDASAPAESRDTGSRA